MLLTSSGHFGKGLLAELLNWCWKCVNFSAKNSGSWNLLTRCVWVLCANGGLCPQMANCNSPKCCPRTRVKLLLSISVWPGHGPLCKKRSVMVRFPKSGKNYVKLLACECYGNQSCALVRRRRWPELGKIVFNYHKFWIRSFWVVNKLPTYVLPMCRCRTSCGVSNISADVWS